MKFLNSVLETVKKYWYLFLISFLTVVVIVVGFIENSRMAGLVNVVKDIVQNYKKQVKTIDKLSEKKVIDDKKVAQTYEQKSKEIQQKRDEELAKVQAKKIKVVEELKDQSADELAKKMKEEFKL